MNWNKKTILITGSSGFLGKTACEFFLKKNANIIAVDKIETAIQDPKLKFFCLDIADENQTKKLHSFKADYCIHLGAISHKVFAENDPNLAWMVNVHGTENTLKTCKAMGVQRMVFASSGQVYGKQSKIVSEETETKPESIYGQTKKEAEELCETFSKKTGLHIAIARQTNAFGPNDLPGIRIIPSITDKAIRGNIDVQGDGSTEKDFIYVYDLMEFYEKVFLLKKWPSSAIVVNVGTGKSRTIKEVVITILNLLKIKQKPSFIKEAAESYIECYSVKKAFQVFGWKAKTPFKEGLRQTIEWLKKTGKKLSENN
ncbi:MAG: NAD(P)-dependent oxidoreductase [Candidatus Diapherotrites archaeon]|nr:NAD(P)-dependent oxidoreductase [Candidatus Diapherotrites archaeon]